MTKTNKPKRTAKARSQSPALIALSNSMETVVSEVSPWDIRPSPENDKLYKPVDPNDPSIIDLAESIRRDGLLEPIVITHDFYVVSGHRRLAACRLAGLEFVHCRVLEFDRSNDPDRFVKLLREHNRQRVKSFDEQIREAVIDADPDEARTELEDYRREKSKVGHEPLLMNDTRQRKEISVAKSAFVAAIDEVLDGLADFGAVSDRQIHYGLLNNPPLMHASKPNSRYCNDQRSYKSLVELLARMRVSGMIPFEAITDETRPVTNWKTYPEPGAFVTSEVDGFLKGYYRDLQQSQPNHIEVLVEKNTVAGLIRSVCAEFRVPMTSGRGFCSLPPRYDMAKRFEKSGKSKLILLAVTDLDPDGESIAETFARSMRDDFGIKSIHPIKVALTYPQVGQYNLPACMEAKVSSSRCKSFVEKYGRNVWELEALPPATLQQTVRDAITGVMDLDLFTREQQAETADAVSLKAIRVTVQTQLAGIKLFRSGTDDE